MPVRPQISVSAPGATEHEAAAVVAAIEQFLRDRAPVVGPPPPPSAWLRAALREGVDRRPGRSAPWV